MGSPWRKIGKPGGDSLAPAVLAKGLRSSLLGAEIMSFRRAVSTNDIGLALAGQGCPEGTVIVADMQTGGRGRLGRSWVAPAGTGLLFSVVLRPELPVAQASALAFLGALAGAAALRALYALAVELKWPNDIMLGTRKLGGVLAEIVAESGVVRRAVVGVGINVNMSEDDFPPELRAEAVSVAQKLGSRVPRAPLLRRVLEEMDRRYDVVRREKSAKSLVHEWRATAPHTGRIVRVKHNGEEQEGTVAGFDDDGALLLRSQSGSVRRLLAADVTILR